jgi:lysophospholipase L1-like esterase
VWRSAAVPANADYSVTAVIRSWSSPGGLWGPIGRCEHQGNYFYAAWYSGYQTGWVLYKRVSGTLTQLGSTVTATLTNGNDYTVTLDLAGTTIRLLVGGVAQITATDSAIIEAGTAGLAIEEGAAGVTTGKHLDSIRAEQSVAVPAFLTHVSFVVDGDSIFGDYSRLGTRTISMVLSGASRWNTSRYWNYAVAGQTVVNALSDATTQIDPLFTLMSGYTKRLCVVMLGINDVIGSDNAATIEANIRAYHSGRRSAGFKTVGITLTKASSVGGANETKRQAINSGLVADPSFCDYFVNAAVLSQFSNTADPIYFVDGVHLTVVGADVLADSIVAAVG